jgi:hypothetical protein
VDGEERPYLIASRITTFVSPHLFFSHELMSDLLPMGVLGTWNTEDMVKVTPEKRWAKVS